MPRNNASLHLMSTLAIPRNTRQPHLEDRQDSPGAVNICNVNGVFEANVSVVCFILLLHNSWQLSAEACVLGLIMQVPMDWGLVNRQAEAIATSISTLYITSAQALKDRSEERKISSRIRSCMAWFRKNVYSTYIEDLEFMSPRHRMFRVEDISAMNGGKILCERWTSQARDIGVP